MTPIQLFLAPSAAGGRSPGAAGWLLMAPLAAWLALFVAAPLLILFVYSLFQRNPLGEIVAAFTLRNYAPLLDVVYLQVLGWSIFYAGLTTRFAPSSDIRLPGTSLAPAPAGRTRC